MIFLFICFPKLLKMMKNTLKNILPASIIAFALFAGLSFKNAATQSTPTSYEYKQFSTVESIISGGMGRSRILTTDEKGTLVEKDLLNFYSLVGINFGNIANNDRAIVDKINEWTNSAWELT
jgi:Na+/H+ antiporter NhaC